MLKFNSHKNITSNLWLLTSIETLRSTLIEKYPKYKKAITKDSLIDWGVKAGINEGIGIVVPFFLGGVGVAIAVGYYKYKLLKMFLTKNNKNTK